MMKDREEHERANERKWDERSATFETRRHVYFRVIQRIVLAIAGLRENMHLLDMGCGTGWAVRHAALRLGCRGTFTGVDLSGGMIDHAIASSAKLRNVRFYKASAEELPVADNSVDRIICTNSFHHYRNPRAALAEARRVLVPGGRIFILDVSTDDPFLEWIDRRTARREKEHVRFYSASEMKELFIQSGLKYVASRRIAYPLKVHIAEKSARWRAAQACS
jgi:ubiquinone/menaquinone biosynthesis C-methylase UbiE